MKNMGYYKVIISGGRSFTDFTLLKKSVDEILSIKSREAEIVIISGVSKGADMLGERYACEAGYEVEEFPEELAIIENYSWSHHNEMTETADECICFWDGKSNGTKQLIELAGIKNINLTVVPY